MSRIVLFFPKIESQQINLLPLGLLLIAAPLIKNGYFVKIIDQRVEPDWKEKLLDELKQDPLLVGISVLTSKPILYGLEVSKLVKQNSKAKVVWGGFHPSLSPEQTLKNEFVDIAVIREGEETLLELANRLSKNRDYNNVLGIAYKRNEKIYVNSQRPFIDLNKQLDIPYHLVEVEKYVQLRISSSGEHGRELAMYTSRGCPFRCAFCYNKELNKRKWRAQSAEKVVMEIEKLVKDYQVTSFHIQDDEFFTDLDRVEKICQGLMKKNIKVEFISLCRIDYVCRMDDNFLSLIRKNGFKTLALGVESGSSRMLKIIQKDITVKQVLEAVAKLKKFNIEGKYLFMIGFPGEKIEDMYKTTDLMREIKRINPFSLIPAWRIFTPFPGTDLYQKSVENGWDPPQDLEGWANYNFNTVKMPWIDEQRKKIIKNVAYLVQFLRLQDKPLLLPHRILGRWVDFRWRNHLFSFILEKKIIDLVIKFKKKIV